MIESDEVILSNNLIYTVFATKSDLKELAIIAKENFISDANYSELETETVQGFVDLNSEKNILIKLKSSRHTIIVAKNKDNQKPIGFCIFKIDSNNNFIGTRAHVQHEYRGMNVGKMLFHSAIAYCNKNTQAKIFFADASGKASSVFKENNFLFIGQHPNKRIKKASVYRFAISINNSIQPKVASEFLPLLLIDEKEYYLLILKEYGLLFEDLFKNIERMHETGNSGISQSVFEHVRNGLLLMNDIRDNIGDCFFRSVNWQEAKTMWIIHDIGEFGMDKDIPNLTKSSEDREKETKKTQITINSIKNIFLMNVLNNLFLRYENIDYGETDLESILVKFVDKFEAAEFIGKCGVAHIWKNKVGVNIFEEILDRFALGLFFKSAEVIFASIDVRGKSWLKIKIIEMLEMYKENCLISQRMFDKKVERVERISQLDSAPDSSTQI
ncbi:GNAT family N-acetyltransferase [Shewanella sp. 202IG2-18]|uniref:GNAT family N-acetyltransferase n=1 Tax=Parashewanella hymeniacidonis TaxID=2807618 RepID=UPI00195FC87D|nr:GNAT family N-acetyltransferase [Parashewanella hymeniacidonis]MBM7074364.1 GNAT family N-acetyltransferase [Parashewanella hymeniacidonis]